MDAIARDETDGEIVMYIERGIGAEEVRTRPARPTCTHVARVHDLTNVMSGLLFRHVC